MKAKCRVLAVLILLAVAVSVAVAQGPPGPPPGGQPCVPPMGGPGMGPGMGRMGRGPGMGMGPMGMGVAGRGMGKWWTNSELVKQLGLSNAQVQQMENIFQRHRSQLIDLRAALDKQEATLAPMIEAQHPDEAQVTAQIDKVAQARAALEKSNALMLLGIRRVLTVEQWNHLRSMGMRPVPQS